MPGLLGLKTTSHTKELQQRPNRRHESFREDTSNDIFGMLQKMFIWHLINVYTLVIIYVNGFKVFRDILTVTAHESVGHGLVAAVRESPVAPAIRTLSCRLMALVSLALPRADADDPVHQLALGLLLFQVVVLGDAVDELTDLVGLAGERRVRGALGQLVDLVQGVKLQQLLGD